MNDRGNRMTNDSDPGWQPSLRNMIPFVGLIRVRRGGETNGLTILRTIFLALVAALFLYFVAFSYIEPWDGGDERWLPWAVVAIGIVVAELRGDLSAEIHIDDVRLSDSCGSYRGPELVELVDRYCLPDMSEDEQDRPTVDLQVLLVAHQ